MLCKIKIKLTQIKLDKINLELVEIFRCLISFEVVSKVEEFRKLQDLLDKRESLMFQLKVLTSAEKSLNPRYYGIDVVEEERKQKEKKHKDFYNLDD